MQSKVDKTGVCALCQQTRLLCESHIIPRFVEKRQKWTSKTGRLTRIGDDGVRHVQSAFREPLLCRQCEDILQDGERQFCDAVYDPYSDGRSVFTVGPWLLQFVVGIAFRGGMYAIRRDRDLLEQNVIAAQSALERWRRWLLGDSKSLTSGHYLWIYPLPGDERDDANATIQDLPFFSAHPNILAKGPFVVIAVFLPGFLVLGGVQPPRPILWRPIRIRESTTVVMARACPDPLLVEMMGERGRQIERQVHDSGEKVQGSLSRHEPPA